MITSNISVNRACPVATFKTKKNNQQTSFKGNISENQNQGMTQEQTTWLAVGLAVLVSLAIGVIAWACSKKEALNANKTSKPVDKATVKIKKQFKELDDKMQKHFVKIKLEEYNPKWDMVKTMPNMQITSLESKNDFSLYEQMVLVPQLLGRNQQLYENKRLIDHDIQEADDYADKNAKIKETFVEYLKLRSEYFDKGNDFDVVRSEVLKNPSDDVVDAETLRLSMLANNTRQFLYSDESVEEPHEMAKFVQPLLIANYTAKMLEDFKPKKENLSENEKKYFDSMNKLGAFWHEHLKKEASEKLPNFVKIITGEVDAPKCYTKGQEEVYDKRYIFVTNSQQHTKLSDILSSGIQDNETYMMEQFTLKGNIKKLEGAFISLKDSLNPSSTMQRKFAEKIINQTISEVLI